MTTDRLPRSTIEPVNPVLNASRRANLPHVPGIRIGDYIFLSGMGPIDPVTGERELDASAERESMKSRDDRLRARLERAQERVGAVHLHHTASRNSAFECDCGNCASTASVSSLVIETVPTARAAPLVRAT